MDWMSVGVLLTVMAAMVLVVWRGMRVLEARDRMFDTALERLVTYRGVHSPEAKAVDSLSGLLNDAQEKLLYFSAEGRDMLRERHQHAEIVKGLQGEIALRDRFMEGMGVRARVPEMAPMPPAPPPDVVQADFTASREL